MAKRYSPKVEIDVLRLLANGYLNTNTYSGAWRALGILQQAKTLAKERSPESLAGVLRSERSVTDRIKAYSLERRAVA